MTRCDEFYEKAEKEGNFCDMSERTWNTVKRYITQYWSKIFHSGKKVPLTEAQWVNQQRKTAENHKQQTKGLLRGGIAPTPSLQPSKPPVFKTPKPTTIYAQPKPTQQEVDNAFDVFKRMGMPGGGLSFLATFIRRWQIR